ncbi:hypothetical protein LZ31DRAFT_327911 [Colletotrichum somersetense]|nr:hypothetical protein LZ31DRAFT_327911 [Colletotrichum somersetense]
MACAPVKTVAGWSMASCQLLVGTGPTYANFFTGPLYRIVSERPPHFTRRRSMLHSLGRSTDQSLVGKLPRHSIFLSPFSFPGSCERGGKIYIGGSASHGLKMTIRNSHAEQQKCTERDETRTRAGCPTRKQLLS